MGRRRFDRAFKLEAVKLVRERGVSAARSSAGDPNKPRGYALATIRGLSFGGETRALPLIKEDERKVILEAGQHTVHVDFFIQDIVPPTAVRTVHANELIPRLRDGFRVGLDIEACVRPSPGKS